MVMEDMKNLGGISMNLLNMTDDQIMVAIKEANEHIEQEGIDNDPIANGDFLGLALKWQEANSSEGEG